jgi:hypothetical protein
MLVVILLFITNNEQCYNTHFLDTYCLDIHCLDTHFLDTQCYGYGYDYDYQINNSFSLLKYNYYVAINEITRDCYQDIAVVVSVFMFSLFLSILFISNCIYKKMIDEFVEKYNNNKSLYEYDSYFYKFLDEYDSLEKKELNTDYLNLLRYKYIKENTPCGDVILCYNNEYNSFDYYCKKSNSVGFNYLEVVSRIYVVNFDCKTIYNDNFDNLCVLYNIKYGINNSSSHLTSSQENSVSVFFSKKTNASKQKNVDNYVSNTYKYKGTLDEFYNHCTINNFKICYSTNDDVSKNESIDSSSCFFNLEKILVCDDLSSANVVKSISFKSFKSFKTLDTK